MINTSDKFAPRLKRTIDSKKGPLLYVLLYMNMHATEAGLIFFPRYYILLRT